MEKAAAYAISAFIVGLGLWILIAGTLFMGSRCSHPHSDRVPERFRSHLKSIPFGETRTLALFSRLRRRQTYAIRLRSLLTSAPV